MPQTWISTDDNISISLPNSRGVYAFGDTINGFVVRQKPLVSPRVHVNVTLWGRSKVKVIRRSNDSSRTYRSNYILVNGNERRLLIFDGPAHVPPDGSAPGTWRFSLPIPTHVSPSVGVGKHEGFLPIDPVSASGQPLPPTFQDLEQMSMDAFVEYYLEAQIFIMSGGATRSHHECRLPVAIRNLHPGGPISSFNINFLLWPGHVGSQRLVPGMTDADLSASQKVKKFFHASSVPQFHFHLEVGLPTHIQLDSPYSTPFNLRVIPDWSKTTEVIQGVSHTVKLLSASLELESTTTMLSEQFGGLRSDKNEDSMIFLLDQALATLRRDVIIPCSHTTEPLNVGRVTNLRVLSQQMQATRPSLLTYNIRFEHVMIWKIKLEIAGEDRRIRGQAPVVILPPSAPTTTLSPVPQHSPHPTASSHSPMPQPAPGTSLGRSDTLANPPPPYTPS